MSYDLFSFSIFSHGTYYYFGALSHIAEIMLPKKTKVVVLICLNVERIAWVQGGLDMSPIIIKCLLLDMLVLSCSLVVPCINIESCLFKWNWFNPAIYCDIVISWADHALSKSHCNSLVNWSPALFLETFIDWKCDLCLDNIFLCDFPVITEVNQISSAICEADNYARSSQNIN